MKLEFLSSLEVEEMSFRGGIRYDVIQWMSRGRTYFHAKTIDDAYRTIEWLKRCGNDGDFEIREHIWPWDNWWTKIRKKYFGRVYYDSEWRRTRSEYNTKLSELKEKYG